MRLRVGSRSRPVGDLVGAVGWGAGGEALSADDGKVLRRWDASGEPLGEVRPPPRPLPPSRHGRPGRGGGGPGRRGPGPRAPLRPGRSGGPWDPRAAPRAARRAGPGARPNAEANNRRDLDSLLLAPSHRGWSPRQDPRRGKGVAGVLDLPPASNSWLVEEAEQPWPSQPRGLTGG